MFPQDNQGQNAPALGAGQGDPLAGISNLSREDLEAEFRRLHSKLSEQAIVPAPEDKWGDGVELTLVECRRAYARADDPNTSRRRDIGCLCCGSTYRPDLRPHKTEAETTIGGFDVQAHLLMCNNCLRGDDAV